MVVWLRVVILLKLFVVLLITGVVLTSIVAELKLGNYLRGLSW